MLANIVVLMFLVGNAFAANITCPDNKDCLIDCSGEGLCNNATIVCPSSNTSETYNCMVLCTNITDCHYLKIIAGASVANLSFVAKGVNVSYDAEIIANGTSFVDIICNGSHSCGELSLNVVKAKVVNINVMRDEQLWIPWLGYAMVKGRLTVNDSEEVYVSCSTIYSCNYLEVLLFNNEKVNVRTIQSNALLNSDIVIHQASQVLVQAETTSNAASLFSTILVFERVKSLAIEGSSVSIINVNFFLANIEDFFLNISGTGELWDCIWYAANVSHVAINDREATSYWIVDGTPIEKSYNCSNDADCNIRVDMTPQTRVTVRCPMKIQSTDASMPTCTFYCTAYSGCDQIELIAINTPSVQCLSSPHYSNNNFSLIANATELKNGKTTVNVLCNTQYSCRTSRFAISGYDTVTLGCNGESSCERIDFSVSDFSKGVFLVVADATDQSNFVLASGSYVSFAYYPDTSRYNLQTTYWSLTDISKVDIECVNGYDCVGVIFDNTRVNQFSVVCGGGDGSGFNCYNAAFNNYEDTSFNLTCALQESCVDVAVRYDVSDTYDSSCTISCLPAVSSLPTCDNVTIIVDNSALGFDDISLSCPVVNGSFPCQDVTVKCKDSDVVCQCPVVYNPNDDSWNCEGMCGTSACKDSASESKKTLSFKESVGIVAGGVACLWIIAYCGYRLRKRYSRESLLLSNDSQGYST